ncbi:MAG: carboxylesterase/lipase family protein [Acidimicrobiales bacterium]
MANAPRVELDGGRVSGTEDEGVLVFRGIPYATADRFAPPAPAVVRGDLAATAFGPIAPQAPGAQFQRPDLEQHEQCLSLNVWTPGTSPREDGTARPVMVWIHGGAFRSGSSASPLYEGTPLARRGDVVVVSINYRLGALGFLAHPSLSPEGEPFGSWGLLDCVEALRWVATNIRAFGGDPGNVTIFGESAGGAAVSLLCVMPVARGLFHKAIVQSGAPLALDVAAAAALAEDLAGAVGASDVPALRDVPLADLLDAQARLEARVDRAFVPVIDGVTIPLARPLKTLAQGSAAGVPLLIGTNVDEWKLWAAADPHSRDLDEDRLRARLDARFGADRAGDVIDALRAARADRGEPADAKDLFYAAESERTFRVPGLRMALAQAGNAPTFAYLFEWGSPAMGGWLGACHGLEIAFVFGTQGRGELAAFTGSGPEADALAEQMMDAWLAFAHTGDPSTATLRWPRYEAEARPTMVFGRSARVEPAPRDEERAAVEAALFG